MLAREIDLMQRRGVDPDKVVVTKMVEFVSKHWKSTFMISVVQEEAEGRPNEYWVGYHEAIKDMMNLLTEHAVLIRKEMLRDSD